MIKVKPSWDWLQRRIYHRNGRVTKIAWVYVCIPIAIGLIGNLILNSYAVWALGITLQLLSIALLITGSKKYQHSAKNG